MLPLLPASRCCLGNILNRDRNTPDSVEYSFDWGSTLISMNSSLHCLFVSAGEIEK